MRKIKFKFLPCLIMLSLTLVGCAGFNISEFNPTDSETSESTGSEVESESESASESEGLPTEIVPIEEPSIQIHYLRTDDKYDPWCLWLWAAGKDGAIYEFNYTDVNGGLIAHYPISTFGDAVAKIGFIVREKTSWTKDVGDDRFMDLTALTADDDYCYHIYIKQGKKEVWTDSERTVIMNSITKCEFLSSNRIAVVTNNPIREVSFTKDGEPLEIDHFEGSTVSRVYYLKTDDVADAGSYYLCTVTFDDDGVVLEKAVSITALYDKTFDEKYNYDGELGAIYTPEQTEFKVWSPVSKKIILKVYDTGTPLWVDEEKGSNTPTHEIEMKLGDKGVYSATISGDLQGKYYTYTVFNGNNLTGTEIVDPYAKSAGVNGVRGMIVDFSRTNPEGWDEVTLNTTDRKGLTVWETHVADVTSSSTWTGTEANRKKFLGLIEEGTTYSTNGYTVKTGFDHIKELGVNAVQLIPIFDQANDEVNVEFNWGYNPLNYNVIEGAYSSNPFDGYTRIREFKEVVKKFAANGMDIIMDVVYNHTNGLVGSNFDVLMPGYYYRYTVDGLASNGSGCGNETASEKFMFRKFMIDSATFLAEEYKLGGYRFDLMAVHDLETMNLLTAACKEINPNITIYGEPWAGGTTAKSVGMATQANASKYQGYGQFNDQMRDALIKGGLNSNAAKGWVSNDEEIAEKDVEVIQKGMKGITSGASKDATTDPNKTVNYVTCHDNFTLVDRFEAAGISSLSTRNKMAVLANSVVFTSQGTSFMLAGEEMLRTKGGDHNSYCSSYKVNELNYDLKVAYPKQFEAYQKLIALKQNVDGLHLNEDEIEGNYVTESLNNGSIIKATFKDSKNNVEYVVYHSNGVTSESDAGASIPVDGYEVYLDTLNRTLSGTTHTLKPFETLILSRSL